MNETIIEFDRVVAGYSPSLNVILNETTLDARKGEITLLIGPNGAGKSTVLKTLFGLLTPRSGEVRFEGRNINGKSQRELLADGIAFVPQGRNLFGSLVGAAQPRARRDHAAACPAAAADRGSAAALSADSRAHRQPGIDDVRRRAEAAGDQSRAAPAAARAADRRAVDRPVAEARAGRDGAAAPVRLADDGVTILMVEQNVRTALKYADRALVLEMGRLALDRPASELLNDPDLNRLFLGGHAPKAA